MGFSYFWWWLFIIEWSNRKGKTGFFFLLLLLRSVRQLNNKIVGGERNESKKFLYWQGSISPPFFSGSGATCRVAYRGRLMIVYCPAFVWLFIGVSFRLPVSQYQWFFYVDIHQTKQINPTTNWITSLDVGWRHVFFSFPPAPNRKQVLINKFLRHPAVMFVSEPKFDQKKKQKRNEDGKKKLSSSSSSSGSVVFLMNKFPSSITRLL